MVHWDMKSRRWIFQVNDKSDLECKVYVCSLWSVQTENMEPFGMCWKCFTLKHTASNFWLKILYSILAGLSWLERKKKAELLTIFWRMASIRWCIRLQMKQDYGIKLGFAWFCWRKQTLCYQEWSAGFCLFVMLEDISERFHAFWTVRNELVKKKTPQANQQS